MPPAAATLSAEPTPSASLLHRLLARIITADTRYREARRLKDLPDERLRDLGVTRAEFARRCWQASNG